jgi:hypothetical protein
MQAKKFLLPVISRSISNTHASMLYIRSGQAVLSFLSFGRVMDVTIYRYLRMRLPVRLVNRHIFAQGSKLLWSGTARSLLYILLFHQNYSTTPN